MAALLFKINCNKYFNFKFSLVREDLKLCKTVIFYVNSLSFFYRASDTLRKSQGSSSEHLSMSSRSPSVYETPPLPKDVDAASVYSASMYEQRDVMTSSTESSHGLNTFSPPGVTSFDKYILLLDAVDFQLIEHP